MDLKTLPVVIITLLVAVILTAVVLVPVVNDAVSGEHTYRNEGYFHLQKYEDDFTFSWNYATPSVFTINGETVTYDNTDGSLKMIVLGKAFKITISNDNTLTFFGGGAYVSGNATYPEVTASLSSGTFSITNGTNSKNITSVTEVYSIAKDGPYVMKKYNVSAYLEDDSEIYATDQNFSGAYNILWHLEGTTTDMDYPNEFNSNITVTDPVIHGETRGDLYAIDSVTFTATVSTQSGVTYNISASEFVVPATVSTEYTNNMDPSTKTILSMIPLLVVLGLIVGAAGVLIIRRSE